MDWGLVLASQGIDTTIEKDHENQKYILIVSDSDYDRAIEQIRLYQIENRRRKIIQLLDLPADLFNWSSFAWAIVIIIFYVLQTNANFDLTSAGQMHKNAVLRGEWWRLFTAISLHKDIAHLACNATVGFIFIGFAMVHYGVGLCLLLSVASGAFGNFIGILLREGDYYGLGASGMVMGALGLLAGAGWFMTYTSDHYKAINKKRAIAGFLLFILLGMNPGSDVQAHAGGFLSGYLLGRTVFSQIRVFEKINLLNPILLVFTVAFYIFCWWNALN